MNDPMWQRTIDFVGTQVDNLLVILDLNGGMYYSLNGSAAAIWELLANPSTEHDLVDGLVSKYQVTPENCAHSVQRVLSDLCGKGLVKTVN